MNSKLLPIQIALYTCRLIVKALSADVRTPTHGRRRTDADAQRPTHGRRRTDADARTPTLVNGRRTDRQDGHALLWSHSFAAKEVNEIDLEYITQIR